MTTAKQIKIKNEPRGIPALLNRLLADAINLRLSAKQAHWNAKGENFFSLHQLFDKVADAADEYADLLAERIMQLDGAAQGTLAQIHGRSRLSPYPEEIYDTQRHIEALTETIAQLAKSTGLEIEAAAQAGDAISADLLTEVARGLDKLRWLVESNSVQTGEGTR